MDEKEPSWHFWIWYEQKEANIVLCTINHAVQLLGQIVHTGSQYEILLGAFSIVFFQRCERFLFSAYFDNQYVTMCKTMATTCL